MEKPEELMIIDITEKELNEQIDYDLEYSVDHVPGKDVGIENYECE